MAENVEMTPITPAEGGAVPPKVSPFGAPAATAAPASAAESVHGAATIKLKPVIRRPMIHKPVVGAARPTPAPSSPATAQTEKKATQNLKAVTGPIPMQATLKKTGIIAEGIITPQQQQASKTKTSRISLESAIGVSPAKENGPAPLKTIRLRRPTDLKPATPPSTTSAPTAPAAPVATLVPPAAPEPVAPAEDPNVTQKKTLKLHRPGGISIKPPSMNLKKPEPPAPANDDVPPLDDDVPELPPQMPFNKAPVAASDDAGVPKWVSVMSIVVSVAALLVLSCLVTCFVEEARHATGLGANEMAFLNW